MASSSKEAVQQALHMTGGVGDKSYANNSLLQKKAMLKARPILEESIKRVYCSIQPKCFVVADLGCSSGPNTLQVLYDIINIVDDTTKYYSNLNLKLPLFQFFLNDLYANDFNTTFNSLPQFYETLKQNKGHEFGPCFINATPGTFYKRLFPNNSIHFFHSSYSLHWLSQVPIIRELGNRVEPAKKEIYLTSKSPISMQKAYVGQFQHDLKLFLKLRSEELITGGAMVLTILGRAETSELRTGFGLINIALNEMVSENIIEEVKLESFYMPLYDPTIEEAKQVIEEEGSFSILRLETITMSWDSDDEHSNLVDEKIRGEFIANYIRAVIEPLLKAHFGEEKVMYELFLRLQNKIVKLMMEAEKLEFPSLVISLVKNA